jgi:phage tail-like protein
VRGVIPGLVSPHPLGLALPAMFQEDSFAQRFVTALDDVLAPVPMVIDNLDAYLDPALTPPDFLPWLAGWVGLELDENWTEPVQRRLIAESAELYRWRGTRRGVVELLTQYLDLPADAIEILESGGASWSVVPGSAPPGTSEVRLTVRIHLDDPTTIDPARIDRLVTAAKPAHVTHEVEVVPR